MSGRRGRGEVGKPEEVLKWAARGSTPRVATGDSAESLVPTPTDTLQVPSLPLVPHAPLESVSLIGRSGLAVAGSTFSHRE